ncbi:MAG: hypothetical protein J5794_01575 [Lachnospiraceae bacterium]|nr:hypothetical protein [Lachnospiraceae bacterium]
MFYINQRDYPAVPYLTVTDRPGDPYGTTTTVKTSACGLCASMMALDRLFPTEDYSFTLEDALALSYETGANHGYGTDGRLYFPAFAKKFGLRYEESNDLDAVRNCLRTGGTAIALVGDRSAEGYHGVFTHSEHYICLIAELPDGRFEVLDPCLYEGKFEEPGRQGKVELFGHVAITSPEVLIEDTLKIVRRSENPEQPKTKAFHLFWRF